MTLPIQTLNPKLYALTESLELGKATGREAGLELAPLEERAFEGGEFKLRPLDSVRHRPVFVLQSLVATPGTTIADSLVRLLFLLNGLREAGARAVHVRGIEAGHVIRCGVVWRGCETNLSRQSHCAIADRLARVVT